MKYRIVADSSSDVQSLSQVEFASVPLKITVGSDTFVDNAKLDVAALKSALRAHKGASHTACPSPAEWYESFGDADCVFCVTITSTLSGSYNAAMLAARDYEHKHPGRKVYVVDTLSTGAEMALIVDKLEALVLEKLDGETIFTRIKEYLAHSHLSFILQSVRNLANNGRVNPAVAALVGLLGIRIVGIASDHGDLQPMSKNRGDKRGLKAMLEDMINLGYQGGRVRIHHCNNPENASRFREMLLERFPHAKVIIDETRGLCSYYAEDGGMLVGYEVA